MTPGLPPVGHRSLAATAKPSPAHLNSNIELTHVPARIQSAKLPSTAFPTSPVLHFASFRVFRPKICRVAAHI
jgi:hypothetical protein